MSRLQGMHAPKHLIQYIIGNDIKEAVSTICISFLPLETSRRDQVLCLIKVEFF